MCLSVARRSRLWIWRPGLRRLAFMMTRRFQSGPIAERMRRSVREISLAIALTLAALVFVVSAIQRTGNETVSIATPDQGAENTAN